MVLLHHNGLNAILAEEMGLGKTLQTIFSSVTSNTTAPSLAHTPSSCPNRRSKTGNWNREFALGPRPQRRRHHGLEGGACGVHGEPAHPRSLHHELQDLPHRVERAEEVYVVMDEAHRIKNVNSVLSQIVRAFLSRGRLLITGSPLQNDLKELFFLLNFIHPRIFQT